MVKDLKQHVYRAGVDKDEIFADAFISAQPPAAPPIAPKKRTTLRILGPDPAPAAKHSIMQRVRFDVAATFDGALERFRTKNPTIDLVTIATYDGLLTDIVLVRGGLDAVRRRALEATLFRLPDDPSDEAARARSDLAAGSVTAFAPWSAGRFKGFKRLYEDE